MQSAKPDKQVLLRTELFHTDSVVCGASALALKTNAPTILRKEALDVYSTSSQGAFVFGSKHKVLPEKAIVANSAAVREWDSNGTVFGYNDKFGREHQAGEFGHNDFYPVVVAACQMKGLDGETALKAMLLSDEIRGRLAEVFSLKSYKIDHVVHGAIASAVVYGNLMGATHEQIEAAIGMVVAHYIPWRAIRAGKQLSDSKGASAAISAEAAVMSVHRAMRGFLGPRDIFRNPEAIFRYFQGPKDKDESPFDLVLSHSGDDFAVMGMHFKLGLYEHQSAGAIHGVLELIAKNSSQFLSNWKSISNIKIIAYEPAFGIIGNPEKRNPKTRQSADHSMVFIISRIIKKALKLGSSTIDSIYKSEGLDGLWKKLILTPHDYSPEALLDAETKEIISKITFEHGGKEFDSRYPEGIPTQIVISSPSGTFDSGLVMFPGGHAKNTANNLNGILENKFLTLGEIATGDRVKAAALVKKLTDLSKKSASEIQDLYYFDIADQRCIDG